jgi:hypothetical protein
MPRGRRADYERADGLRERTRGRVFKERVEPHWFGKATASGIATTWPAAPASSSSSTPPRGRAGPPSTTRSWPGALARVLGGPQDPARLPVERIAFPEDGSLVIEARGKAWRYDEEADTLEPTGPIGPEPRPDPPPERGRRGAGRSSRSRRGEESPDGKWVAVRKDHDLFLRDKATGEETRLTDDGTEADGYEPGVFWSPDSRSSSPCVLRRGTTGASS